MLFYYYLFRHIIKFLHQKFPVYLFINLFDNKKSRDDKYIESNFKLYQRLEQLVFGCQSIDRETLWFNSNVGKSLFIFMTVK